MEAIEIEIDDDLFLPVYQHLKDDADIDIDFLYGSRDSGKSRDIAQRLILKCLHEDYFRYILARKIYGTIKDSQWQLLKDIVTEWGLDSLFKFTTHPLEIKCVNGNKFVGRGFDNPQSIKSFQNPSGAWIEEGNQLTQEDWITLITSLRSNTTKTKIDFSFNPDCDTDYRSFWLYKDYFAHTTELSFTHSHHIEIYGNEYEIKYRATHSTYHDNPYCSPQRMAVYEDLKNTSPYHYRIYGLGLWGNRENKSPFILTFSREKHLAPTYYDPSQVVFLSFDFNKNPMCCSVIQWDGGVNVNWIEVIKLPNSTIYQMCDVIKIKYQGAIFIVNGDYSGGNVSALVRSQDLNDYYKVIKAELGLIDTQFKLVVNPRIEENQVLCNYCFQHLNIKINPDTCQPLIFDIEFVEMLADGTMKKSDRNDPTQQADAIDTCFAGKTMITTIDGDKRIDEIKVGDLVQSKDGLNCVVKLWEFNKEVYEFTFSDDSKITCTQDHKFFTNLFGYLPICDIFAKNISVCKKQLNIKEEVTPNIQSNHITTHQTQEIQGRYTGKYGLITMKQFLKVTTFITKMKTRLIMMLKTLKLKLNIIINTTMGEREQLKTLNILSRLQQLDRIMQKIGTDRQLVKNGINNMQSIQDLVILNSEVINAITAKLSLLKEIPMRGFAQTIVSQHGGERTTLTKNNQDVKSVEPNLQHQNIIRQNFVPLNADQPQILMEVKVISMRKIGVKKVYDLTVSNEHCYFANGFLVHNCRYFFNKNFHHLVQWKKK